MDEATSPSNERLLADVRERRALLATRPEVLFPWWRPCAVKALLVTDGSLDFGAGDFGLSTFVDALVNDRRSYVRFDVHRAHRGAGAGIVADETSYRFDVAHGFAPDAYDEVWLFGFDPSPALGDDEVAALAAHMAAGGGVFATGDHGNLGRALCAKLPRVRQMRYWDSYPSNNVAVDQVAMTGPWRNDTNQSGTDVGSQFSDQSDDVPQPLDLKLYSAYANALRIERWPHPVMCSRFGRIDKFPDHPHEGEVRDPESLTDQFDGADEFPMATDGSVRVAPEIVAWGRVPAGNTSGRDNNTIVKMPTNAHSFGVVSTYDGHRSGVGRIVCDSTWHHFVNVNLIGVVEGGFFDDFTPQADGGGTPGTSVSKHTGFLSSTAGQAVLDRIREYYVNIGVWIAPAGKHECFASRAWWEIIWNQRVVESSLTVIGQPIEKVSLVDLRAIGVHARDVIGRRAGVCSSYEWMKIVIKLFPIQLWKFIDPWLPWPVDPPEPPLPLHDLLPLLDVAIGAAALAVHREFPHPVDDVDALDERLSELVASGSRLGLRRGLTALEEQVREVHEVARGALRVLD